MDQTQEQWLFTSFENLDAKYRKLGFGEGEEQKVPENANNTEIVKNIQNEKKQHTNNDKVTSKPDNQYHMNWNMIIQCVSQEMYPMIANNIQSIIDNIKEYKIGVNDFDNKHINK